MADSYDFRGVRINIDVVAEGHGIRAVTRQLAAFSEFQRSFFRMRQQLMRSVGSDRAMLKKTVDLLDKRAMPLIRETGAATQKVIKGPSQDKDIDRFRAWHKGGQGAKYWQVSPRGRNLIQSYLGGGKMDVKGLEHLSRDQRFLNSLANEISNTTTIRGRPPVVTTPRLPGSGYPANSINPQGRLSYVDRQRLGKEVQRLQAAADRKRLPGSGTVPDRPLLQASTGRVQIAAPKERAKINPASTKAVGPTPVIFTQQQSATVGEKRRQAASRMRLFTRNLAEGRVNQITVSDYARRFDVNAQTAQAELGALAHGGYLRQETDFTGRNPRFISTSKVKRGIPEAGRPSTATASQKTTREIGGRVGAPESLSRALVPASGVRTHGGRAQGRLDRRILRNFNAAQKNLIMEAFSTGATYTANDYVRKFGVTHATALKHLRDLSARGYFSQSEQSGRYSFRARTPRQIATQAARDNRTFRMARAKAQAAEAARGSAGGTRAWRMRSGDTVAGVGGTRAWTGQQGLVSGVVQDANAPIRGGGRRPPPSIRVGRGAAAGGRTPGKAGPFYRGGTFDHFMRHSSQAQLLTAAGAVRRFTLSLLALPGAAALGAVAVGVFASMVAGSFQKAFVGVRKTVDATPSELAKVREDLIQAAFRIPMSFKELAKGGKIAGQLGTPVDEIRKQVELFSKFQVATEIPFEEGATSLMKSANVLGALDQVENLASAIVHMGNTTIALEREMLPTIARISFWSKQMGFTPAETVGISAATASAALRPNQAEAFMRGLTRKTPDILQPGRNAESRRVSGLFNELVYAGGSKESATELLKRSPKDFFTGLQEGFRALYDVGKERQIPIIENFFRAVGLNNAREKSTIARLFTSEKDIGDFLTSSSLAFEENVALQQEFEKAIDIFQAAAIMLGSAAKAFMDTIGTPFNKGLRPFLELLRDEFFIKSRKNLRQIMGIEPSTAPYMYGSTGGSTAPDFGPIRDQYLQLVKDFFEPYTRVERQRQSLSTLYDLAESLLEVGRASKGTVHWMIEAASSVNRFLATHPAIIKFFLGFAATMTIVGAIMGGLLLMLSVAAGPLGWASIAAGLAIAGIGGVAFALGGLQDKNRETMSSIELFVDTLLGQKRRLDDETKLKDSLTGPFDRYSANEQDRETWFRTYMDSIQDRSPAMRAMLGTGALIESGLRQSGNSMAYLYEKAFAQLGIDRDVFLDTPQLPSMDDLYKEAFALRPASTMDMGAYNPGGGRSTSSEGMELWQPYSSDFQSPKTKLQSQIPAMEMGAYNPGGGHVTPPEESGLQKVLKNVGNFFGFTRPRAEWRRSTVKAANERIAKGLTPAMDMGAYNPGGGMVISEPAMEMGAYNPGGGHVTPPEESGLQKVLKNVGNFFGFTRPRAEWRRSTVKAANERIAKGLTPAMDMGAYNPGGGMVISEPAMEMGAYNPGGGKVAPTNPSGRPMHSNQAMNMGAYNPGGGMVISDDGSVIPAADMGDHIPGSGLAPSRADTPKHDLSRKLHRRGQRLVQFPWNKPPPIDLDKGRSPGGLPDYLMRSAEWQGEGKFGNPLSYTAPNMIRDQPSLQSQPPLGSGGTTVILNGALVLPAVKNADELIEELSKMAIGIPFEALAEKISTPEVTGGTS